MGDHAEVLVDGGIRSGADAVRAVALGARAAMVGRAWAYGLCAAGRPGVARILRLLREDVDRTMRLLGVARVPDLDSTYGRGAVRLAALSHGPAGTNPGSRWRRGPGAAPVQWLAGCAATTNWPAAVL